MIEMIRAMIRRRSSDAAVPVDSGRDAHVALCVLLLEAAQADGECSRDELEHVNATLIREFGVPRSELEELLELAWGRREESVDLFQFTRYLNNTCTKAQKVALMESVWRVIHADGMLEAHEDQFAHKLANLLRLTHRELIEAKMKAREYRRVEPAGEEGRKPETEG